MKPPIPKLRLTMSEVCAAYSISRDKVHGLIRAGFLTPEKINGKGKLFFHPQAVEALFKTPPPPSSQSNFNLKQIADETYAQVFGSAPTNARLH